MTFRCAVCGKFANLAHRCAPALLAAVVPSAPARPRVSVYRRADGVVVRAARAADLPVIAALDAAVFGTDCWDFAQFAAAYRDPRTEILAMLDGDRLLGYGMVNHRTQFSHVTALSVDASVRGRGLGELLLRRLMGRARVRGVPVVKLEVRADNPAAKALYDKAGFVKTGVVRRYYADGCTAVQMRHRLVSAVRAVM